MQQRIVRDLMRIRHGHVVPETATLREVAERLIISDCDIMAVTDSAGKLSGVVCEASVVRALIAKPEEAATIQSIVSRHAESVRLDSPLNAVLPLFRSSANTAIPVIDDIGRVSGLLMRRDVIGSLLQRRTDFGDTLPFDTSSSSTIEASEVGTPESILPLNPNRNPNGLAGSGERTSGIKKPHFLRADEARRLLWSAEDRL